MGHDENAPLKKAIAAGLCALLLLLCCDARAASPSWACAQRLPDGECIGSARYRDGSDNISGTRGFLGSDRLVWLGELTRVDNMNVRTVCAFAPDGRCLGDLTTFYPYGKRRSESLRVVDGVDQYVGVSTTINADGQRLECVVNIAGDCDGEAVLQLPSKEILHGVRKARGYESAWVGSGRWIFRGGEVKDCLLNEDGSCKPGPLTFWDKDSKRVGTLGSDGLLVGPLTIFDSSGRQKYCPMAVKGGCPVRDLVVTQAPPDAWKKPLPKTASTARPNEIRASFAAVATVVIGPPDDSAELRYQMLVCGDEVRLAYSVLRTVRPSVPFRGQVWMGEDLIGVFDDPAARKTPATPFSCRSPQTRRIAPLAWQQPRLPQHRFVDGSELWTMEERIRLFLDRLTVRPFRVVNRAVVATAPRALPVPLLPAKPAAR
ncbi:hypothetical protein [Hydrocarboniphaga sp.]|uniref:hypothetical protein n=1 Tax=Hydrocarboniphaga sp. TaxID=2033016 RepID=UPI003D0C14DA